MSYRCHFIIVTAKEIEETYLSSSLIDFRGVISSLLISTCKQSKYNIVISGFWQHVKHESKELSLPVVSFCKVHRHPEADKSQSLASYLRPSMLGRQFVFSGMSSHERYFDKEVYLGVTGRGRSQGLKQARHTDQGSPWIDSIFKDEHCLQDVHFMGVWADLMSSLNNQ